MHSEQRHINKPAQQAKILKERDVWYIMLQPQYA